MGRRSSHTADELHQLVVDAASDIVEKKGYQALSARAIAGRIGYSPGTLYNVFKDLDHLVLTIEQRLLDALADRLAGAETSQDPVQNLCHFASAFQAFTQERPKLWNLLTEHRMPAGREVPDWYQEKLENLLQPIEAALAPYLASAEPGAQKQAARTLWASVHGMTSLSTANKLSHVTARAGRSMVDEFMSTYLAGLKQQRPAATASR